MALVKTNGQEKKLSLWRPFGWDRNIQQAFENFLDMPKDWEFPMTGGELFPAVDISETPKDYSIRAEIPGMKKEDIKITINKNVITLTGEKKEEKKTEGQKFHRLESYYGSFQRSFVLPDGIKADKVEAAFKDGVLSVTVPKSEETQSKTVEIKVG